VLPESCTVIFGAFDRHNLGDLLFAHVVAALLPGQDLVFAGIADRDLTAWGGHRVEALARLAAAAKNEHWPERLVARLADPALLAQGAEDHVMWVSACAGDAALIQAPIGGTPEDYGRVIRAEMEKWGKIIRDAGIKVQ